MFNVYEYVPHVEAVCLCLDTLVQQYVSKMANLKNNAYIPMYVIATANRSDNSLNLT